MSKGEPIIKGKEALADAYADCYSDKPLDRWQALHDGYFQGYKDAEKDLGWISVKDRLPEEEGRYITCHNTCGVPTMVNISIFFEGRWVLAPEGEIEYWMPMPKLPKEKEI